LDYSTEQLAPLQGLSKLHTLKLSGTQLQYYVTHDNLQALCQLSALQHLTALQFESYVDDRCTTASFKQNSKKKVREPRPGA
jgi:hypothetical protein